MCAHSLLFLLPAPQPPTHLELQVKIYAWYDNEWGYSCRLAELCRLVARKQGATASHDPPCFNRRTIGRWDDMRSTEGGLVR